MTSVRGPYWDKTNRVWRVKWVEGTEGKSQVFQVGQKARATAFKASLKAKSPTPTPSKPIEAAELDNSVASWNKTRCYCRQRLLEAADKKDDDAVDRWSKTSNAIKNLAASASADRDLSQAEERMDAVEAELAATTGARRHGTRVRTAEKVDDSAPKTLRRDDTVH